MNTTILLITSKPIETDLVFGYVIGAIIALFIPATFCKLWLNILN